MKDLIIGLDFDGTCVVHEFPEVGEELPYCIDTLKHMQHAGAKIVLNTMRSDREDRAYLTEAVNWLKDRGIELYGINENPTQKQWTASPKVYAHIYIDDAAFGAPIHVLRDGCRPSINWLVIAETLKIDIKTTNQ